MLGSESGCSMESGTASDAPPWTQSSEVRCSSSPEEAGDCADSTADFGSSASCRTWSRMSLSHNVRAACSLRGRRLCEFVENLI